MPRLHGASRFGQALIGGEELESLNLAARQKVGRQMKRVEGAEWLSRSYLSRRLAYTRRKLPKFAPRPQRVEIPARGGQPCVGRGGHLAIPEQGACGLHLRQPGGHQDSRGLEPLLDFRCRTGFQQDTQNRGCIEIQRRGSQLALSFGAKLMEERICRSLRQADPLHLPGPSLLGEARPSDFPYSGQRPKPCLGRIRRGRTDRAKLGDHLVPVGDEHGFPNANRAQVLRKACLQLFDSHGSHAEKVVTRDHQVNFSLG